MNSKKPLPDDLAKRIKPSPVDLKQAEFFINRAKKDLSTASRLQETDLEGAYQFLYTAMLHSALGCMVCEGVRPDVRGKHKTVVDYIAHALGKNYESKIQFYDRMRKRRHQFIYDPGPAGCTEKEIEDAKAVAEEFLAIISRRIKEQNPQMEFSF